MRRGIDELGRYNHRRVRRVCNALKARGLACRFDEKRARGGDALQQMAAAVDRAEAVVVFVTRRYLTKARRAPPCRAARPLTTMCLLGAR